MLQKAHFTFAKVILSFLRRELKVSFGHNDAIVDAHRAFAREQDLETLEQIVALKYSSPVLFVRATPCVGTGARLACEP